MEFLLNPLPNFGDGKRVGSGDAPQGERGPHALPPSSLSNGGRHHERKLPSRPTVEVAGPGMATRLCTPPSPDRLRSYRFPHQDFADLAGGPIDSHRTKSLLAGPDGSKLSASEVGCPRTASWQARGTGETLSGPGSPMASGRSRLRVAVRALLKPRERTRRRIRRRSAP